MNLRAAVPPPILSTMDEVILYPEEQLSFSTMQRDEIEERDDESFVVLDRTWFWFAIVFLLLIVLVRMTRKSSSSSSSKTDDQEDGFLVREKASLARMARWGHPISNHHKKYHYYPRSHHRNRTTNTAPTTKNPGIVLSDQGAWHLFKANTRIYTRSEQQQQQSLNSVRRAVSMRTSALNNNTNNSNSGDLEEGVFLPDDDNQAALQAPVTEVLVEEVDEEDVHTMLLAEQKSLVLGASCVCCAICFDSYKVGDQVTWIEPCCHQFHTHCVMNYSKTKWNDNQQQQPQQQQPQQQVVVCPLCRVPFLGRDENTGEPVQVAG